MEIREYVGYDGVGLAALIRSGEVSAAEVESVARRALAAVDPVVNGLAKPVFERALRSSRPPSGEPSSRSHQMTFFVACPADAHSRERP